MTPRLPKELRADDRLTGAEVCRLLCIHRNTLRNAVNDGRIARRVSRGGKAYYLGRDVKAMWINW